MTTTTFLTMAINRDAVVDSATSNSTDAIANLLDGNLKTTWVPSSTANQTIDIDTNNTALLTDGFGLWITNNNVDMSGVTITLSHSPDDSTYTPLSGQTIDHNLGNLFWWTFTGVTKRYWRVVFSGLAAPSALPIISQMFLLKSRSLSARPKYPVRSDPMYKNNVAILNAGYRRVSAQTNNKLLSFNREFTLVDTTRKDMLHTIYNDSQGELLPFIYQEETNVEDAFLCRFVQELPEITEIDFDYFDAKVSFEQLPFILVGETI